MLGSQDVNVNFLPVAKATLSLSLSQRPRFPPPWSLCSHSKKPFCFLSSPLCNQTLRNISTSGRSVDRETPASGGFIDFQWRETSPQCAIQSRYFSTQPIFCCDCHASVLMAGCSNRLSYTGVTQPSTLIYQYHTPP